MSKVISLVAVFLLLFSVAVEAQDTKSPYAGQQKRQIKALSEEEVQGYLVGRGIGLARAAELNSYPGPMHVLELADKLGLTPEQKMKTEALITAMREEAQGLGAFYVKKEQELDELFSSGNATTQAVDAKLQDISLLHAQIRAVHLKTHIAQRELLTSEQVKLYDQLRGYSISSGGHPHRGH
jgi:Spy/CpxP family protein refolding chaperone